MKPRASALSASSEARRSTPVRAHDRVRPPSALYNSTSFLLMQETGFVPDMLKPRRLRLRVKAGRKVT